MRHNDLLIKLMVITLSTILAITILAKSKDFYLNICQGGCNFYFPYQQSE